MKRKKNQFFSLLIVLMFSLTFMLTYVRPTEAASGTVNVLMIGNSLTYYRTNSTIRCLQKLESKSGYNIRVSYVAYSNECLRTYANEKTSRGRSDLFRFSVQVL